MWLHSKGLRREMTRPSLRMLAQRREMTRPSLRMLAQSVLDKVIQIIIVMCATPHTRCTASLLTCLCVILHMYAYTLSKTRPMTHTHTPTNSITHTQSLSLSFLLSLFLSFSSEDSFREIAGLFRMAPRGHVETLTPRT